MSLPTSATETALLHVDRHILHDLGGAARLAGPEGAGLAVHNPGLTFATPDHAISSAPGRAGTNATGHGCWTVCAAESRARQASRLFDVDQPGQGIVHVIGPELGLSLPGCLIVCGDSHTCTHGGMGALAFGIGTSEVTHVLATQSPDPAPAEDDARALRGRARLGVTAEGPDPRI